MTIFAETTQQPKKARPQSTASIVSVTNEASLVTVKGIASRVILDPRKGGRSTRHRKDAPRPGGLNTTATTLPNLPTST